MQSLMTIDFVSVSVSLWNNEQAHPALKREDRLGKDPFAGFGTVVGDIKESGYTNKTK